MLPMQTKNSFHDRALAFSAGVLRIASQIRRNPDFRSIADQLLRSGTAGGANAQEARSAESRADFIHKMGIALKELREAGYWLALVDLSGWVESAELPMLRKECNELTAILVASIRTAQKNSRNES
jgi:four helix bundle protein